MQPPSTVPPQPASQLEERERERELLPVLYTFATASPRLARGHTRRDSSSPRSYSKAKAEEVALCFSRPAATKQFDILVRWRASGRWTTGWLRSSHDRNLQHNCIVRSLAQRPLLGVFLRSTFRYRFMTSGPGCELLRGLRRANVFCKRAVDSHSGPSKVSPFIQPISRAER